MFKFVKMVNLKCRLINMMRIFKSNSCENVEILRSTVMLPIVFHSEFVFLPIYFNCLSFFFCLSANLYVLQFFFILVVSF